MEENAKVCLRFEQYFFYTYIGLAISQNTRYFKNY